MKSTAIFGVIIGFIAVIGAMYFKHIQLSVFLNPAAFFVIFVGSVACILNAFPGRDLKNLGKLLKIIFTENKNRSHINKIELINTIDEISHQARKDGVLSIESRINELNDRFLVRGFRMAVDGLDVEQIHEVLSTLIEEIENRHETNANIFSQAGTYAPTLGVLGAVFGLIAAMSNINDTSLMAEAVAAAFIATILGIFTGYVLWNPFANKLRMLTKHEISEKRMITEGIISMTKGENPFLTRNKMLSFLSEKEEAYMNKLQEEDEHE